MNLPEKILKSLRAQLTTPLRRRDKISIDDRAELIRISGGRFNKAHYEQVMRERKRL